MSLHARGVSIRFGGVLAVDDMSIDVAPGEIVGLIGPNGAGKTTFIDCVTGASRPQTGLISWNGVPLIGLAPHRIIACGVVRTFQNVASLHGITVLDIVKLGAAMAHPAKAGLGVAQALAARRRRDDDLIAQVLEPLKLKDVARRELQTLPYGLRKAVDLARALAVGPRLLLLDEPVAGLPSREADRMTGVIRDVRARHGCAMLMVEHKMDVVNAACDRIIAMAAGKRIFEGSPAEFQADADVRRVYLGAA